MKLLLVEDEPELADTLRTVLERERFVVDHADHLAFAREAAMSGAYDLVLLDRTLPDGDGLSLIPLLRAEHPGLPILVLSARGEVPDRVVGLDRGADDYLIKPFALEEMLARIRAVRRRPTELGREEIHVGALVYDVTNESASVDGVQLELPRRELLVLAALVRRRGRTVLRETLEQAVYGFDDLVDAGNRRSSSSRR
jgi:DNA-binding response OmpR family regulator